MFYACISGTNWLCLEKNTSSFSFIYQNPASFMVFADNTNILSVERRKAKRELENFADLTFGFNLQITHKILISNMIKWAFREGDDAYVCLVLVTN